MGQCSVLIQTDLWEVRNLFHREESRTMSLCHALDVVQSLLHLAYAPTAGYLNGVGKRNLIVVEFFSTVPGKNFDLCIISTRTKTH